MIFRFRPEFSGSFFPSWFLPQISFFTAEDAEHAESDFFRGIFFILYKLVQSWTKLVQDRFFNHRLHRFSQMTFTAEDAEHAEAD